MISKKYEVTNKTVERGDRTLHRIRALRDFGNVEAGDIGGYIEGEANLSHDGGAWIYGNAAVFGNASVSCNAAVYQNSMICGNAWIYDNAVVSGDAAVFGNAAVYKNSMISGNAKVSGNASVSGNAVVYSKAEVSGGAKVSGDAEVCRVASKTPVVLIGFPYIVTITDNHCKVGCEVHSASYWLDHAEEIVSKDGYEKEAKLWASIICALIKEHCAI